MRRLLFLLSVLASLAFASEAMAAEVVTQDDQGRQIRFDVQADGVDVEWYAAILRAAPHGEEITMLRIVVVTWEQMLKTCGREAAGCYTRNVMVIPAAQTEDNAHTLVHEYGHHLDRSTPVAGQREPNGTSTWWHARGMERLIALGSVYRSYVKGWNRSIAEIFAEDYAQLARPGGPHKIPWLENPTDTILAALRFDLGIGPEPTLVAPPALKPVAIARRGTLAAKRNVAIPFGLLGPGRRVQATATLPGATEKAPRARLEIRCNGERVALKTVSTGKTTVTIDQRNLGPADECTATLTSTSRATRTYTLVVRLSVTNA